MSIEISFGYFSLIVNFEYINFAKPKGGAPVSVGSLCRNDGDGNENVYIKSEVALL